MIFAASAARARDLMPLPSSSSSSVLAVTVCAVLALPEIALQAQEADLIVRTGAPANRPTTRFSPDRSIIDSVTANTPALLNRWDRSACLANGAALGRVRASIAPKTFDQRLREARAALQHLPNSASRPFTTTHHPHNSPYTRS
ncbi:MAG: hypothetical protein ACREL7_01230 [Longimicrobiales bacterium]